MSLYKWSRKFTYVIAVSFPLWNETGDGWTVGTLESEKIGLGHFVFLSLPQSSFFLCRETLIEKIGYIGDRILEKPNKDSDAVQRLAVIRSK